MEHLGIGKASLPSVVVLALSRGTDKGARWRFLCRVLVRWTLGKEGAFVEYHLLRLLNVYSLSSVNTVDTRHRLRRR
jgi:hypothetical protein